MRNDTGPFCEGLHAFSDCYVSGFSSSSYDAQFVSADAQSPARGARSRPHGVSSGQPVVLWSSLQKFCLSWLDVNTVQSAWGSRTDRGAERVTVDEEDDS